MAYGFSAQHNLRVGDKAARTLASGVRSLLRAKSAGKGRRSPLLQFSGGSERFISTLKLCGRKFRRSTYSEPIA